jgi:hypothetical protein
VEKYNQIQIFILQFMDLKDMYGQCKTGLHRHPI